VTKADLEHLWHLNRAIARDLERLHELQSALSGRTSSISGLPHTGILKDNTGLYVAIIDELKQAMPHPKSLQMPNLTNIMSLLRLFGASTMIAAKMPYSVDFSHKPLRWPMAYTRLPWSS